MEYPSLSATSGVARLFRDRLQCLDGLGSSGGVFIYRGRQVQTASDRNCKNIRQKVNDGEMSSTCIEEDTEAIDNYTVKKVIDFPVPSRVVSCQNFPGR
jgi:hypothetical protein